MQRRVPRNETYTSEGDTPSFLPLVDNGLEHHLDYARGGWGGRAVYVKGNFMQDGADDNAGTPDMHYMFWRWIAAAQNDWAARSDWFVAPYYKGANHQPDVSLEVTDRGTPPLTRYQRLVVNVQ